MSHWSFWWVLESQRYLDLSLAANPMDGDSDRSVALGSRVAPSRLTISEEVVPGFLARLGDSEHPEVVSSILIAAARAVEPGGDQSVEVHRLLREHLGHPFQKVRESAILGLGLIGTVRGGDDLALLLGAASPAWLKRGDHSVRARSFAAHGLGLAAVRVDDDAARGRWATALVHELESRTTPPITFQVAAVEALGLVELTSRPESASVKGAARHTSSSDALAEYLAPWVGQKDGRATWVQAHAAVAAGRVASRASAEVRSSVLKQLTKATNDRKNTAYVRTAAAIGLGELANSGRGRDDAGARRALQKLMKKGQPLESRFARMALVSASSRPGPGDDSLAGAPATRRALLLDLKRSRTDEIGWTALALGSLDWKLRQAGVETGTETAKALAKIGRKRRGDDTSAALGLGLALALQGTDHAEDFEDHLLDEFDSISSPIRRSFMALALGIAGTPRVEETLRAELKESSGQTPLLWNASIGLLQIDESTEQRLIEIIQDSSSLVVRRAALRALAQSGSASSVKALLAIIEDPSEQDAVRAFAVDSLAALCDSEEIPWRDAYSHGLPYFAATPTLNGSGNDSAIIERPW